MLAHLHDIGVDIKSTPNPCDYFSVGMPLDTIMRYGMHVGGPEGVKFLLKHGANPRPNGRGEIDAFGE